MIGYKLKRPDCGGWLFAGTTRDEVAETVKNEMIESEEWELDQRTLVIEAFEITQEEIDNMPEFQGWI